jgi:hypothetical protein
MTVATAMPCLGTTRPPTLDPGGTPNTTSIDELRRAWRAVEAGEYRTVRGGLDARRRGASALGEVRDRGVEGAATEPAQWIPAVGERVIPVIGCAGSVGASTLAVAIAVAAAEHAPVRLLECSSLSASGIAAATTVELGLNEAGWAQGHRNCESIEYGRDMLLERTGLVLAGPAELPLPMPLDCGAGGLRVTVVDVGWEVGQALASRGWLGEHVRRAPALVLVAVATVPGLRRLETALDLLSQHAAEPQHQHLVVAIRGFPRHRWPKGVSHSAGPRTRALLREGRTIGIPYDPHLAVQGLGSAPLPKPLGTGAAEVLRHLDGHLTPSVHVMSGASTR